MTARERAERLLTDLIQLVATEGGYFSDPEQALAVAMAALADAERGVWEEAAKMAEEKAERSIKGEHLNIPEYNFGYRGGLRGLADEIRLKLYAKAQAGQEG